MMMMMVVVVLVITACVLHGHDMVGDDTMLLLRGLEGVAAF